MERVDDLRGHNAHHHDEDVFSGDVGQAGVSAKLLARKRARRTFASPETGALPVTAPKLEDTIFQSAKEPNEQFWVMSTAALGIVAAIAFVAYASGTPADAAMRSATVAVGGLTCWSEPGVAAGVVEEIAEGEVLRVGGSRNGWTQVVDKGCWAKESQLIG